MVPLVLPAPAVPRLGQERCPAQGWARLALFWGSQRHSFASVLQTLPVASVFNSNSKINKLQPPPEPSGPLLASRLQTRGIEPRRRRLDGFVTPPHGPRPPLEPCLEPLLAR